MAVRASVYHDEGFIAIDLYPGEPKAGVISYPDDRIWPFEFNYDDEQLARGELVFLGIHTLDVSFITDRWLSELDKLDLPRISIPEIGMQDASIADVLRWARDTYPSRYTPEELAAHQARLEEQTRVTA